ncbi:MAG: YbjN domain-containing protein [Pyrinomonadaceae bacterium]|nr:YbjN domain-containing protein [Pyrinomonadaceae bacterium]MCX7639808.1 YbjN domain-containing protein [Pyrinomonadaceae bacterium]MDW8304391.1 YbjN domain-containing protein [Acidobacteriota bacterium]
MSSRVTLELIKHYLEKFGWDRYASIGESTEKEGLVITGWQSSSDSEKYGLFIDPVVEKGVLLFRVPEVFNLSDSEKLEDLLKALNFINHRIILGKFTYDPVSCKVAFSLNVSIQGGTVTYEQFQHCLLATIITVEKHAQKLREIAEGKKNADEFISDEIKEEVTTNLSYLEQIFKGMVKGTEEKEKTNLH